jgi:hypothetical protein
LFRSKGAITVIGGPHARCYPEDALRYFDYVLGFTDRETLRDVLRDCCQHRPVGIHIAARQQPKTLPGVRERWQFIEPTLKKAPLIKMIPMLGSLGCPYTCSFCIDAVVPYQPMDFDGIQEDLRFLLTKFRRPMVGWHDPNFGVRFNDYLDLIERAVPPGRIDFLAESSLSLLSEPHLERLKHNGFKALLPGIESWFDLGNKSKTGAQQGMDKVRQVAEHVNLILSYIPYVQTNFVLGLDTDEGAEPFELTKRFLDLTPGAFPGYSLLTAFGRAAPLNLDYQRADRVLSFPFHFLNNNQAMNVRPRNYSWQNFYDHVIDLTGYSFSRRAIFRRFRSTRGLTPKGMNLVRAVSTEGFGRLSYHRDVRRRLDTDRQFLPYFEQETTELPRFYLDLVRKRLGGAVGVASGRGAASRSQRLCKVGAQPVRARHASVGAVSFPAFAITPQGGVGSGRGCRVDGAGRGTKGVHADMGARRDGHGSNLERTGTECEPCCRPALKWIFLNLWAARKAASACCGLLSA